MSFKLSSEARDYFDTIEKKSSTGKFDTMWDKYYLSAMVGIKANDRVKTDNEPDAEPFVDNVIEDYAEQKYEIYAALIYAEIERQSIPKRAESEIRELMIEILDSNDATRLSDYGKILLNCYAEQGFQILQNNGPTPTEMDEFLRSYHETLGEV
jgi:hypothetical protein